MSSEFDGYGIPIDRDTEKYLKEQEDSMDDKERTATNQAIAYLKEYRDYDSPFFDGTFNSLNQKLLDDFLLNSFHGKVHREEEIAFHFLKGNIDVDDLENTYQPDFLDLPENKPTARLILDECGVKTYEVDEATDKLEEQFTKNSNNLADSMLHVENRTRNDGYGSSFYVTCYGYKGSFEVLNANTADQAVETLGYEVKE